MKQKKRKNSKQFNERFRKRFFTKKSVLVLMCAVVILVAIAFGCQSQRRRAAVLEETVDELNTEIKEIKETNKSLEEERTNMDSPEFKEKIARERLGMIDEDEYSLQQSEDRTGETEEAGEDGAEKKKDAGRSDEESMDDAGGSGGSGEEDGEASDGDAEDGESSDAAG